MISSSTSDSDNSLHSLYFTSYHGLINYPQKIPALGGRKENCTIQTSLSPGVAEVASGTARGGRSSAYYLAAHSTSASCEKEQMSPPTPHA